MGSGMRGDVGESDSVVLGCGTTDRASAAGKTPLLEAFEQRGGFYPKEKSAEVRLDLVTLLSVKVLLPSLITTPEPTCVAWLSTLAKLLSDGLLWKLMMS